MSIISFFRAPDGCFQYFFENVNTIMTFNYDGATARANADGQRSVAPMRPSPQRQWPIAMAVRPPARVAW